MCASCIPAATTGICLLSLLPLGASRSFFHVLEGYFWFFSQLTVVAAAVLATVRDCIIVARMNHQTDCMIVRLYVHQIILLTDTAAAELLRYFLPPHPRSQFYIPFDFASCTLLSISYF